MICGGRMGGFAGAESKVGVKTDKATGRYRLICLSLRGLHGSRLVGRQLSLRFGGQCSQLGQAGLGRGSRGSVIRKTRFSLFAVR